MNSTLEALDRRHDKRFPGELEQRKDDDAHRRPITHVGHSANSRPPPRLVFFFPRRLRERCQREMKKRKKDDVEVVGGRGVASCCRLCSHVRFVERRAAILHCTLALCRLLVVFYPCHPLRDERAVRVGRLIPAVFRLYFIAPTMIEIGC